MLRLGDVSCCLQVPQAKVVGGERQPRAIRLGNVRWQRMVQVAEILGAGADALCGVQTIAYAALIRSVFGQHHHPAHARGARCERIPLRFLVGERGQQAPVNASRSLSRFEQITVLGQ